MVEELAVLLDDTIIGSVVRQRRGNDLRFVYDDGYRQRKDATRLSSSMPLSVREHGDEQISNFLWGLLPDNDRVIERWANEFPVSARDPFGILANMGKDCAGAVQFVPPSEVDEAIEPGGVRPVPDEEIAKRLRDLRCDDAAWMPIHSAGRFSLAGAQGKFALARTADGWGEPYGRMPTTHIFKPGINQADSHALSEHISMRTARKLGLAVASTRFEVFEEQAVVVVERFDRLNVGGVWRRVHQEDVCQALGRHPSMKYQAEGGPGAAQVSQLARSLMANDAADVAVRRFADALALNWLIGGTDAHAKNYSFLYSGPVARLAPLYDVASFLPYGQFDKMKMAMSVGGQYRFKYADAARWVKLADNIGIHGDDLVARIGDLAERLPAALDEVCSEMGSSVAPLASPVRDAILRSLPRAKSALARGHQVAATRP